MKYNLIACGGGGITITNIAFERNYLNYADAYAIDASDRNPPCDDFIKGFTIKGKSGSGGYRVENYDHIATQIPSIINEMEDHRFNVLIAAAGSGSGAIIMDTVARTLHSLGREFICILIGDNGGRLGVNTAASIKSLYSLAVSIQETVTFVYQCNAALGEAAVNDIITNNMACIDAMFSDDNVGLDAEDISRQLKGSQVAGVDPTALRLHMWCPDNAADDSLIETLEERGIVTAIVLTPKDTSEINKTEYQSMHYKVSHNENIKYTIHLLTAFDFDLANHHIDHQEAERQRREGHAKKMSAGATSVTSRIGTSDVEL